MLKQNDSGPEVVVLQTKLNQLGYLTQIDGKFGPQTEKNLCAFQADNSLKPDGIYGPLTENVMDHKVAALPTNNQPTPVSNSATPWMDWLERNIGEKEISGSKANQFIVDLFRYTSLWDSPMATSDETAWCAACANAALQKNGYEGTNSAAAASFDNYGEKLLVPRYGAVVTLRHPSGGRHVAFFDSYDWLGRMKLLGGNQGNALKYSSFSTSELVSARWPVKKQT